ncbi:MAG TPA: response regulator [Bryobacteraceae bacterium]|nr:response regulator [Bryobacteraceae bacterium]
MTEGKQQPTVFVVERDAHTCELITHFLSEAKLSVTCMSDGYGALDRARQERPALVITDILIPALDGLALCRLIKSDEALRATKVIVLTVLSAEARAFQSGADAFIKKPIEKKSLVAAVRSLMENPEGK